MRLHDSRVLLTGATGGLGQAIAGALAAEGARVVLSGRRAEQLEEIKARLCGDAEVLPADLEQPGAAEELVERAGAVDVLVANAGLPAAGRVEDFTAQQIDRAIDVNLRAPLQMTRALLPGMLERESGYIVLMSSLAGKVAPMRSAIYSATKFGLRGFGAGLREDLHGSGVGVTVVYPGFVEEAGMFADAGVKLPRWVGMATPDQVAEAVVKGIDGERAEIDVAPLSLRAGTMFGSLAPVTAARVQRRLGSAAIAHALSEGQRDKR